MPATRKVGYVAARFARVAVPLVMLAASTLTLATGPGPAPASEAASHREAPLIAMDPEADITDFFMFRSYETGKDDKILLIMNVIPGQEPSSGPNYWNFDPTVLYSFEVDNDLDGKADDVQVDVQFTTEPIRGTCNQFDLFLSYVALPPITKLDGDNGSEGLCLRQHYSVTMSHKGHHDTFSSDKDGKTLFAVPSNVGPRTMPSYDSLASQGIYELSNGIRVFAGQRDDPFYIDLGGVFDTLNLRRNPPLLTEPEDANDNANPFGVDMLSGFNVSTIALEVPATLLTRDGKGAGTGSMATKQPVLGAYASTSRHKETVLLDPKQVKQDDNSDEHGPWVQVQRLANPLINETIIGTEDKDRWNALEPQDEKAFLDYYLRPRLALALQLVYGFPTGCTPFGSPACRPNPAGSAAFPDWNRDDLVNLLLKYKPSDKQLSELLRLDISVAPTPLAAQRRLPKAIDPAGDLAAWPNGRRPKDDVTDVAVRVVGGPNYLTNRAGDGVNTNDKPLPAQFPFLATPWDGRNRQHQDCTTNC